VLLQAPTTWEPAPQDLALFYALWAPVFAVYLGGRAYGIEWIRWLRSRGREGRAVPVTLEGRGAG
jgi:hypothetical protein